jgi:hypothetical protein
MKVVTLAIGAFFALLLIGSLATSQGWGQPAFDPAEYARQQAEADRISRAAEIDAALTPLDLALAAAWRIVPLVAFVGGLVYMGAWGVAHQVRFRRERWPRADGLLPVEAAQLYDVAPRALGAWHAARKLEAQQQSVPHTISYAPHTAYSHRIDGAGAISPPAPELSATAVLPGLTDLASLSFRPTVECILLGLGPDGRQLTVPMKALWHIGTAGPTGTGKSNIARLILPQLQSLGAKVCIGDPKWTPFDHESGEDWRPIADRLHLAPARKADEIADLIRYFHDELERRLELRHAGQKLGGPLFLYLDEYTTITEDVKDAAEHIARLGRLGRGVGIFLLVAAHDLLVKSGAGDTRDQIRTGFYLGGDVKTGSVLLDLPQRTVIEREGELTTGLAFLRSAATSPAQLVRVPYASNAGVTALLATAPTTNAPRTPGESSRNHPENSQDRGSDYSASGRASAGSAEDARILALFLAGNDAGAIVTALTGMKSKAGTPYMAKLTEVQAAIRTVLTERVA